MQITAPSENNSFVPLVGCKGELEDLDDKSISEGRGELTEEAEEVGNNWDLSRDISIPFWSIPLFAKDCTGC